MPRFSATPPMKRSSPMPMNGRNSCSLITWPFSANIRIAASAMKGSDSTSTPSTSKITPRSTRATLIHDPLQPGGAGASLGVHVADHPVGLAHLDRARQHASKMRTLLERPADRPQERGALTGRRQDGALEAQRIGVLALEPHGDAQRREPIGRERGRKLVDRGLEREEKLI